MNSNYKVRFTRKRSLKECKQAIHSQVFYHKLNKNQRDVIRTRMRSLLAAIVNANQQRKKELQTKEQFKIEHCRTFDIEWSSLPLHLFTFSLSRFLGSAARRAHSAADACEEELRAERVSTAASLHDYCCSVFA